MFKVKCILIRESLVSVVPVTARAKDPHQMLQYSSLSLYSLLVDSQHLHAKPEKMQWMESCPEFQLSNLLMYVSVINLTNRFHVAVCLFSNRSQMTSKCVKNKKVAHEAQLMFLPHFDFLYNLLLKRRTATWKKCPFISNLATLTDTKIALTWSMSIQNEANWLVAMLSKKLWLVQIQNSKKLESRAVVISA